MAKKLFCCLLLVGLTGCGTLFDIARQRCSSISVAEYNNIVSAVQLDKVNGITKEAELAAVNGICANQGTFNGPADCRECIRAVIEAVYAAN